jgi:hypothetical protein
MRKRVVLIVVSVLLSLLFSSTARMPAQELPISQRIPAFELIPAPPVEFPAPVDSNSPAFWQSSWGFNRLHLLTSWENPSISRGLSIRWLGATLPISYSNAGNGGRWMEAVLQAPNGTLYGYYHNEPLGLCSGSKKTAPRIGAARSLDNGFSWEDLGIILEVPSVSLDCDTPNEYFAGGVGDFSVVLDQNETEAYFFFSIYSGTSQGVAVGRMFWALRDTPRGNVALWDGVSWRYPRGTGPQIRRFLQVNPIYGASVSWHDDSEVVDAFWGPSVHWNTFLNQYVMLLNRAVDSAWLQEGIYIAFSPVLDDPTQWTPPVKIIEGGTWYPQVMGLEKDKGTDKLAGAVSRLFLRGRSDYYLVFRKSYSY